MTLAENLQQLRKERGLSQEEVAQKLYLSRQSVSKWENGGAEPGVDNLIALARLYGVTVDELVGNAPVPQEEPPSPEDGEDDQFDAANWGYIGLLATRLFMLGFIMMTYEQYNGPIDFTEIPVLDVFALAVGIWFKSPVMWVILMCLQVFSIIWSAILLFAYGNVWALCSILVHGCCMLILTRPTIKARFRASQF